MWRAIAAAPQRVENWALDHQVWVLTDHSTKLLEELLGGFVVAPLAFFEMEREVAFDAVEFGKAALCEAPKGFDAIDVNLAFGKGVALVDAFVLGEAVVDQTGVGLPIISEQQTFGIHFTLYNWAQNVRGGVGNDLGIDAPIAFQQTKDRLLGAAAPTLPASDVTTDTRGAEEALIGFDFSGEERLLGLLMSEDQLAESHVVAVDGLAIELEQNRCFRGFYVQAEALCNFYSPITAQLAVSEHLSRLSASS